MTTYHVEHYYGSARKAWRRAEQLWALGIAAYITSTPARLHTVTWEA